MLSTQHDTVIATNHVCRQNIPIQLNCFMGKWSCYVDEETSHYGTVKWRRHTHQLKLIDVHYLLINARAEACRIIFRQPSNIYPPPPIISYRVPCQRNDGWWYFPLIQLCIHGRRCRISRVARCNVLRFNQAKILIFNRKK